MPVLKFQKNKENVSSFVSTGRDTLAVLPTGHGKTLNFQLAPLVIKELRMKSYLFPVDPILVIISPLNYLMKEQVKRIDAISSVPL